MEFAFAVLIVLFYGIGYVAGRKYGTTSQLQLRRSLERAEAHGDSLQAANLQLLNTILLMKQNGKEAPPVDDEWGTYVMPEDEDE